ncbi:MAG: DNA helicase-2/ATP-dependent DNA helicase PcrA [Roseivirga sp.]|jgi:DNA helicase-2/ATP-dependent DNA helicase PcrA
MDKRLILAVAGSGKTTHILNQLDEEKRHLIVTYTRENIRNLKSGIEKKFNYFPENIQLFSFFEFLYSFCYKPFLGRTDKPNGLFWDFPPEFTRRLPEHVPPHFFTRDRRIYHNRLTKYLIRKGLVDRINARIEKYYDHFHIDEVQDFGGYDFDFLMHFSALNLRINWVGDFFQHTYDTSRDANKNQSLHSNLEGYLNRFSKAGITIDQGSLLKSRRCPKAVTDFITEHLGIAIETHKDEVANVQFIDDPARIEEIALDNTIIKLFYQSHNKYRCYSSNWGKVKGADHFQNVCVVLNKTSLDLYKKGKLEESASITKNKLYVACSRANRNLYLVPENLMGKFKIQ